MIFPFDPRDPFPLLVLNAVSYSLQKQHSEAADEYFGFQIKETEHKIEKLNLSGEDQASQWVGLPPESLQTPYTEIRFMLSILSLKPGETVVDLGAGYGRMGLVMQAHFPACKFIGVEISKLRAEEGNRVFQEQNASRARLLMGDAADTHFQVPEARIFFIYDLSRLETICRVLDRLKEISKKQGIWVIGRGRATRDQIERHEPWLSQIYPPEHYGNFSVYRTGDAR